MMKGSFTHFELESYVLVRRIHFVSVPELFGSWFTLKTKCHPVGLVGKEISFHIYLDSEILAISSFPVVNNVA